MRLEELVPTRETCERLKAAGFPQPEVRMTPTWFVWIVDPSGDWGASPIEYHNAATSGEEWLLAAPTFAEIAERLEPFTLRRMRERFFIEEATATEEAGACCGSDSCAEAAALLWLALHPAPSTESAK